MTVPDTPLFHFTSIHISSVSFRLFMSCPQNARERKGGTASGKIKGKREGISGSAYFSMREMLSATEWPKQELSLHQWGPLTQAPQRLWGSSSFPLVRTGSVTGTNSHDSLKGAKSGTQEPPCSGSLGGMSLLGHLISVTSLHLFLQILYKVRIQALSENMIPQMKAPAPPPGP